jgi:hypothetical protein
MTILIWFHCSGYWSFKTYYQERIQQHMRTEFSALVSYSRFVEFTPSALLPMLAYLRTEPVPLPPLYEQYRIAAHLDALQANAIRAAQLETQKELDALMPLVLDRAFRGEL